jgi:RNA 2',3'-cyclic 3'-phosphodiesterase
MRLFFAAIPEGETRGRLAAAAQALELDDFSRRVPPENYHLTLAFIGDVPESRLAALRAIGAARGGQPPGQPRGRQPQGAAWGVAPIVFDAYEHWPKAEVVVATASEYPPALEELSMAIRGDLLRQRLSRDPKPFRPHVTMARKVSQAPVFKAMSEIVWTVREFHLVRSDRAARGAVYTVVDTWQLLDTASTHT